jgi:hypothetical protein
MWDMGCEENNVKRRIGIMEYGMMGWVINHRSSFVQSAIEN